MDEIAIALLEGAHGRKYWKVAKAHPDAWGEVAAKLSDPRYQDRMEHESESGRPALAGAVAVIEASPHVHEVLSERSADADRFKQAVGVAVRQVMASLGWSTTGRKGSLSRSRWFTRAERYERSGSAGTIDEETGPVSGPAIEAHLDPDYVARVKADLDRIAQMGTKEEQQETFEYLMQALAATRAEEGRPC